MSEDKIIGAGLTGRPQIRWPEDNDQFEYETPREPTTVEAEAGVMPANCLRVFQSPRCGSCLEAGGNGYVGPCVGLQEDGSCLLDVVRQAQAQGVEWKFEVRWDEYGNQDWRYVGPPLSRFTGPPE